MFCSPVFELYIAEAKGQMMVGVLDDYPSFEKLREYCEGLELAANLIRENSPQKVRVAFILLHNIAEILMYRIAEKAFDSDEFRSRVMPPQFSRTLKRKVRREFPEQIRFLLSQGVLSGEEGATLQIAHDYRTPAFHRDDHNPRALQALACLLYAPLSTLFDKAAKGRGASCSDENGAWLETYGLKPRGTVMFDALSVLLVTAIRDTIPLQFEDIRSILRTDLTERIAVAERNMAPEHSLGGMAEDWAGAMSDAMFWDDFDEQAAAPEYWALIWKMGAGEKVVPEDYLRAEADFNAERAKQRAAFVPVFELRKLPELKAAVAALDSITTPSKLAGDYREIDTKLVWLEDAIEEVHISVDYAIQHAIDVARGK
jgi:hypothetical protein